MTNTITFKAPAGYEYKISTDVNGAVTVSTVPIPAPTTPGPNGPSGNWKLIFQDEFNGTIVNTSTWDEHNGWTNQNNVTDSAANVSENGGNLILKLVSNSSGAAVEGDNVNFAVGDYIEARVKFAGNGTAISGWPAWWVSGPSWPAAGESDIAEGLGTLTVNYHSPSGAHNMGTIPGNWANGFHTYGLHRKATGCDVYWDGQLVKSYGTDDNGQPEHPILTIGYGGGTFSPAELDVDYVRMWSPA